MLDVPDMNFHFRSKSHNATSGEYHLLGIQHIPVNFLLVEAPKTLFFSSNVLNIKF